MKPAYVITATFFLNGCVLIVDSKGTHLRQYTTTNPPAIHVAPHPPDYTSDIDAGIYRGEEVF